MASSSRKRRAPAHDLADEIYEYAPVKDYFDYEDNLPDMSASSNRTGNWGHKLAPGAEWMRRGKIAAWGPDRDMWELEERARKRIRTLLPRSRSPSPPLPRLPHLRAPSPPSVAPYSPPAKQHASFSGYVLDESVQHAFRTSMLPDLQRATCNLIENEAELKRAFGRFFAVLNDPPAFTLHQHDQPPQPSISTPLLTNGHAHTNGNGNGMSSNGVPDTLDSPDGTISSPVKREGDEDEHQSVSARVASAREEQVFPPPSRIFLTDGPAAFMGHVLSPREQFDHLDKALAALREMQDDGREYVERLIELREGLGELAYQRQSIWNLVRDRALKEMGTEVGR